MQKILEINATEPVFTIFLRDETEASFNKIMNI